jgi:hypothetical protein
MTERSGEPADIERDVDSGAGSGVEQEDDGDRNDAVIDADDTGMIAGERDIFEGERAEADEESSSN